MTEEVMVRYHHRLNEHESEQTLGSSVDREAWWATIHEGAESDMT